jgi:hypothetical protein
MKIYVNEMWCDTKTDWGYKSDQEFVESIFFQLQKTKEALEEIKTCEGAGKLVGHMRSIARQALYNIKDIAEGYKKR